nr:MAG TPA: hypothetical protein [Caudoviricetes sp.]DAW93571.1 MAG TPA: hypothetical protein [Bacteriophage sp.]
MNWNNSSSYRSRICISFIYNRRSINTTTFCIH